MEGNMQGMKQEIKQEHAKDNEQHATQTITQIMGGSNCYLLTQGDASVLIDTGLKGNQDKILKQCQGKNVKLIVLTHGHIDHIQNAAYLAEQLQVPVAINHKDMELVQDNLSRTMQSRGFLGGIVRFFSVVSAKGVKTDDLRPSVFLEGGDDLSAYGIDAHIIDLPGHTAGSIGIVAGDKFIIGDALMNMFHPEVSLLYEDLEDLKQSAKKITELGEGTVYFGHGKPVSNRKWGIKNA